MVNARRHHDPLSPRGSARFNVLLTEDRPHAADHWTNQLPRLLEPQGIAAYLAHSGREAIDLAEHLEIHAAVIDLGTPFGEPGRPGPGQQPGSPTSRLAAGWWLIELFGRLPNQPPVVVINSPAYSQRQVQRMLQQALRLGAFSVLNKPVEIEQLLDVFRHVVDRQYRGAWPGHGADKLD